MNEAQQNTAKPGRSVFRKLTGTVPILVTVIVHVVVLSIAAVIVVQEQMLGGKKVMEASARDAAAERVVEHRLQVARRGGASGGSSSPLSANRIFSTSSQAVQIAEMSEIPVLGSQGFGGFAGAGVGTGIGSGFNTATGALSSGGRGFMSVSFLGVTSQNAKRVVFVVDVGEGQMSLRKGGFRAFEIIREELIRLVAGLSPSASFNVILMGQSPEDLNLYADELVAATTANKEQFIAWMRVINTDVSALGTASGSPLRRWKPRDLPIDAGVDPLLAPPVWVNGVRAALEQRPNAVFVITGGMGFILKRMSREEETQSQRKYDSAVEALGRRGLDPDQIETARNRAIDAAVADLNAFNQRQVAAGKDPIIIGSPHNVLEAELIEAVRAAGHELRIDRSGWSDDQGKALEMPPRPSTHKNAKFSDVLVHIARLQKAFVPERSSINIFLFQGPEETAGQAHKEFGLLANRNGGIFEVLTTKRLEEIRARAATK